MTHEQKFQQAMLKTHIRHLEEDSRLVQKKMEEILHAEELEGLGNLKEHMLAVARAEFALCQAKIRCKELQLTMPEFGG